MGWVWKDDDDTMSGDVTRFEDSNPRSRNQCSTRTIVKSQCKTEEVEPGKFVRKCEKTEQLLKDCVGRKNWRRWRRKRTKEKKENEKNPEHGEKEEREKCVWVPAVIHKRRAIEVLAEIRPSEVVQSNKEYTEEDVTDQVVKGSFPLESSELGPFGFPGLRGDIEAIERSLFGNMSRFFEAAEDVKNGFFSVFGTPHLYDGDSTSSSTRRGIPIEGHPPKEASPKLNKPDGHVYLSGLAKDV